MSKEGRIAILANIICCVAVLFMSVGYSNFSRNLTTDEISATVRIEKEIRVNKISLSSISEDAIANWEEYNFNSIEGGIVLLSEAAEIIYTVDILNLSEKEYGILTITGLSEELEYELMDYTLEEKICDGSKCNLGVIKPIKIKIKYKEGMFNESKTEYNFKLDFDFRTYHKINYVDISSTGLPVEIIDGGIYNQMISPLFSKDIEVKSGSLVLVKDIDYTYNDNNLVINIVNDDITITNLKYKVGDYIELDTEGFYVISTDENADALTMLAEWNLNVGNNKITDEEEGIQNESCKGWISGESESNWTCTIAFSSTNYWSSVSSYPAWIYDNRSNLYTHVENYVNKLKKLGYSSVAGRLIKYDELLGLGCSAGGGGGACNSASSWVKNTTFWSGSAGNSTYVWYVRTNGNFFNTTYSHGSYFGVRPVIIINASEI